MGKNEFLHGKTRWKRLAILAVAIFAAPFVSWRVIEVVYDVCHPAPPPYDGKMPESTGEMVKRINKEDAAMEVDLKETIAKHPDFMTSAEVRLKVLEEVAARHNVSAQYVSWSRQVPEHLVKDMFKDPPYQALRKK